MRTLKGSMATPTAMRIPTATVGLRIAVGRLGRAIRAVEVDDESDNESQEDGDASGVSDAGQGKSMNSESGVTRKSTRRVRSRVRLDL